MPTKRGGVEYMSVTELADVLQVHRTNVIYWIKEGKVRAVRLGMAARSPYGIPMDEAQRVISVMAPNST